MRRTQVFKESWAHIPSLSSLSYDKQYHIKQQGGPPKVWEEQKAVLEDSQVPEAFAKFWSMVAEEMKSGVYFRIEG